MVLEFLKRSRPVTDEDITVAKNALLADLQNTVSGGSNHAGYGSLNSPRGRQTPASDTPSKSQIHGVNMGTYGKTQPVSGTRGYSGTGGSSYGGTGAIGGSGDKRRPGNNSLQELDNLLEDLSNSKYANTQENGLNGSTGPGSLGFVDGYGSGTRSPASYSRPSSAQNSLNRPSSAQSLRSQNSLNRPSVDDLLDELDHGDVIYEGPKKVVITVKETKTETGFPGETDLISSHTTRTASSATRELDDLMASLSNIKVNPEQPIREENIRPSKATQSQGPPANLDSMLDNLQADMSRQGVNTSQKGCCSACEKPIVGQVITALGKTWHPEHFTCAHCTQELGTRNFFEREGKPYCEPDYHNLFSPRCAYCNGPILDKCVTALEKTWHMDHFFCAQCGKQFGEDGFHEREGKPYCRDDYFDMFAPKCGACNRAIMENYISALNTQWHPDCFVCRECRQPFVGGSFFDHEGQPYCETHYHLKRGSLCAGCHKPISGRCVTAMFRKFHPEHFVCAFCLKQLNKGTFKEQNDKPYCHICFEKLFG
ncbi:leupaxin isoform X2 [Euwallacea fornicatus]|uniref:leupaxin isoform X2 n=1 Tax=Euwallacea fornicatus TaxID=995702 RepID=UPI00338F1861